MGLRLPDWLIDPFDLRYLSDDIHAIAYFQGHPAWEAVEVMLRGAASGGWIARAILTHHDQSQVDHVNDAQLFDASRASERRTFLTSIAVDARPDARLPVVEARFQTATGHKVAFRVVAAAPADKARGGISDPGDHAGASSLPVMLRGASAIAGPDSWVDIDGKRYAIPEKVRAGPFVAVHGFVTLDHQMAILRAGTRSLGNVIPPSRLGPEANRAWNENGQRLDYAASERAGDTTLWVPANGRGRQLRRRAAAGAAPELIDVVARDANRTDDREARLDLSAPGACTLSIDQVPAVRGPTRVLSDGGFEWTPDQPDWAQRRTVTTRWRVEGDVGVVTTTIGSRPGP